MTVDYTETLATAASSMRAYGEALARINAQMRASTRAANRRLLALSWRGLRYDGDPLRRLDGRARRSGRRHRGTAAWANRHG